MRVVLDLSLNGKSLLSRELSSGNTLVGRNPECDVCIPQEEISPVQFVLRKSGNQLWLRNRSSEGTRILSEGVTEKITEEYRVADGDSVHLGSLLGVCRFVVDQDAGKTETLMSTPEVFSEVFVVSVPALQRGESFELGERPLRLGTGEDADIVLEDPYVSSSHAELRVEEGRCLIRDLESRNGVFIGGQKVTEAEVPPGSTVVLGQTGVVISSTRQRGASEGSAPSKGTANQLIGSSGKMQEVGRMIQRMAPHDAPVLIMGETGTGKEVVARLLATLGDRALHPFIPINCGGLARNLMESELFGHEKGAFTGAVNQKRGAFEEADGGTLFLDEVGELPLDMQPQLLRALENKEIRRVGSTKSFKVNVRLIAATNRALEKEVAEGRFREDLFHRLHVLTLTLPPLRERGSDINELITHFLKALVPGDEEVEMVGEALQKLRAYKWPGNIRELRNVLQRAVLLRRFPDRIEEEDIQFMPSTLSTLAESLSSMGTRTLVEIEREAIMTEMARHEGNKREAAEALGISRSTIHRKIEEYEIEI
jgi:DNA-binding NtrC family response regulator